MSIFKHETDKQVGDDLRHGVQGSLIVPEPPLAGAEPQHTLDIPNPVSPGSAVPQGQSTHS